MIIDPIKKIFSKDFYTRGISTGFMLGFSASWIIGALINANIIELFASSMLFIFASYIYNKEIKKKESETVQ